MNDSAESGTVTLELVALVSILLLPLGLAVPAITGLSDQLLAEQIARHTARYLVLVGKEREVALANQVAREMAFDWGSKNQPRLNLTCDSDCSPGSFFNLEIWLGSAVAIQTMAIER